MNNSFNSTHSHSHSRHHHQRHQNAFDLYPEKLLEHNSSSSWNEIELNKDIKAFNSNFSPIPLSFLNGELDEIQNLHSNGTTVDNKSILLLTQNNNFTNSTTDMNSEIKSSLYSIVIPAMVFFCVLTASVNLIIVISAHWCRKPMSPTLYFSISLALADVYASIILGSGLVFNSLLPFAYKWPTPACLSLSIEALRLGGILVIVSHLLVLAINHWIGIVRPLHYAATMTRRTATIVIILSWIWPILLIFLYFSSINGQGFRSTHCENWRFMEQLKFRVLFASFFFPPLIVMSFIYLHIFLIVKRHQVQRLRYQVNEQTSQQLRRNVKAVVTTVLILGTYVVGWMPAILFHIIVCEDCIISLAQFKSTPLALQYGFGIGVNVLVILKVLVDPIIYAARMADIQFALRKMKYELLSKCFGTSIGTDPLERGFSRYERSMNETKSLRMSSFGSASSTRRPFLNSTSISPRISSRQETPNNNLLRHSNKSLNGHARNDHRSGTLAEMDL